MNSSVPYTLLHIISETISPDALETQLGPLFEAVYGREFPERFLVTIDRALADKQRQMEVYIKEHSMDIWGLVDAFIRIQSKVANKA